MVEYEDEENLNACTDFVGDDGLRVCPNLLEFQGKIEYSDGSYGFIG